MKGRVDGPFEPLNSAMHGFIALLFLFLLQSPSAKAVNEKAPPTPSLFADLDANGIIEPFLRPFSQIYDMMQQNEKALAYAEKVEERRRESPLARSKGLFDLIELLQETTTTTTTQSPIHRFLEPYLDPFKRSAKRFQEDLGRMGLIPTSSTTTTTPKPTTTPSALEQSINYLFASTGDAEGNEKESLLPSIMRATMEGASKALFDSSAYRVKRQSLFGPSSFDVLDRLLGFDQPVSLSNPFTPNPLISIFTTQKPISLPHMPTTTINPFPTFPKLHLDNQPTFKIQDPFYNALLPKSKNRLWDSLFGTLPNPTLTETKKSEVLVKPAEKKPRRKQKTKIRKHRKSKH